MSLKKCRPVMIRNEMPNKDIGNTTYRLIARQSAVMFAQSTIASTITAAAIALPSPDTNEQFVKVPKKEDSSENPPGQWNSYDILCHGGTIINRVNGILQNTSTKATETSGWICLQSEGSPIEFRNIYIEPLK